MSEMLSPEDMPVQVKVALHYLSWVSEASAEFAEGMLVGQRPLSKMEEATKRSALRVVNLYLLGETHCAPKEDESESE